ncbi:hypothetical protein ACLB2K_041097 [Fragaria x ananassa]
MLRACALQYRGIWDKNISLIEFAYNNSFHSSIGIAPFEALYGRQCHTPLCWNKVGERELCGPEIIHDTNEKIKVVRDRLKAAQSRQKSYADVRRKDLEFQVERVGSLAYRLVLPPELSRIHNVFHVSMLRKYIADPSHVLEEQPISLQKDLSYEEEHVQILDRKEQVLRSKSISLVKVLWRSHQVEEATWESEEQMRQQGLGPGSGQAHFLFFFLSLSLPLPLPSPFLPGFFPDVVRRRPAAPARHTGPKRSVSDPAAVLDRWQPPWCSREGGIDVESSGCPKLLFVETPSFGRHSRRAVAQKEALLPCFNPSKGLTPSRARIGMFVDPLGGVFANKMVGAVYPTFLDAVGAAMAIETRGTYRAQPRDFSGPSQ